MDYGKILQRAFTITIEKRSIWPFGILMAIFQAVAQSPNGLRFIISARDFPTFERFWLPVIEPGIVILFIALILGLVVISIFVGLLSRAAIIGMVSDVEKTGSTNVNSGFSYGFRNLLRLFAIYLAIWVPFALFFLVLFAIALAPLLLLLTNDQALRVLGIASAVTLGLSAMVLVIAAAIGLSLVQELIDRNCVLRGQGVFGSIANGFRIVRSNLGRAALMWLILVGVNRILGMLAFALFLGLGAVVAIPAFVAWQASQTLAIALAVALGLPALAAFVFFMALVDIYVTTAWTLAYLEIATVGGQD